MSNELYLNYNSIIGKLNETAKELTKKISGYSQAISSGENTIAIENEIEEIIKNFKDTQSKLDVAYSNRNAPPTIPTMELDRRQKEIQKQETTINDLEKKYQSNKSKKYSFKGENFSEGYKMTEDMKSMNNNELLQLQKEKLNEQDKMIDDIRLDVKKGKVLAKESQHLIKDQNKQLDDLQEEVDKLDSRFQRGIKRFQNYAKKQSGCCIGLIIFFELVLTFLIFYFV